MNCRPEKWYDRSPRGKRGDRVQCQHSDPKIMRQGTQWLCRCGVAVVSLAQATYRPPSDEVQPSPLAEDGSTRKRDKVQFVVPWAVGGKGGGE
jgi:hypothetical protein